MIAMDSSLRKHTGTEFKPRLRGFADMLVGTPGLRGGEGNIIRALWLEGTLCSLHVDDTRWANLVSEICAPRPGFAVTTLNLLLPTFRLDFKYVP